MVRIATQQTNALSGRLNIDARLVFGVLCDLKVLFSKRAVRIEQLGAVESFAGKLLIGSGFLIIGVRGAEVGAGNGKQNLPPADLIPEARIQFDDAAGTERSNVNGPVDVRADGTAGGQDGGERAGLNGDEFEGVGMFDAEYARL
jgi:hypothetical protein